MELILIDKVKLFEVPFFAWRFFRKKIHRSSKFESHSFNSKIEISIEGNKALKTEDLLKNFSEHDLAEGQIFQKAVIY